MVSIEIKGLYNGEITCRLCKQDDETASHILLECPALGRRRIPLSGALDKKEVDVNIGFKVLDLVRGRKLRDIADYITSLWGRTISLLG